MSRTRKGTKPLNCDYDYWSKRIGNKGGGYAIGRNYKKETLSRERMAGKEALIREMKENEY